MSAPETDQLFDALLAAHPRSLQILRRVYLEALPRADFERLYGVTPAAADALLARALDDARLHGQTDALQAHRAQLLQRLDAAARAWATSPDRVRDERLRWLAIALVLALSAFFYWQQSQSGAP